MGGPAPAQRNCELNGASTHARRPAPLGPSGPGLRFSFNQAENAQRVESAVRQVLADGLRTGDIFEEGCTRIGCEEMMAAVAAAL